MCGIYGVISPQETQTLQKTHDVAELRQAHKVLRHRGPDWEGEIQIAGAYLAHHRLSIIDPEGGSQPIVWGDAGNISNLALCVNGEIYNHRELKALVEKAETQSPAPGFVYKTGSDCEVIMALYSKAFNPKYNPDRMRTSVFGEYLRQVNGIFAFILVDECNKIAVIARDQIGVIPLYYGYDSQGRLHVASEMKAFLPDVTTQHFPPGHFMVVNMAELGKNSNSKPKLTKYYKNLDMDISSIRQYTPGPGPEFELTDVMRAQLEHYKVTIREALISAVERQLMADVPFGALLSGGLDSTLVCAIAIKALQKPSIRETSNVSWDGQLRTFSIGLEGADSTDLKWATRAAKWLGTKHYNMTFTMAEGLAAVRDVIWHLETYDVTTIRASTPMFLLARKIKAMGLKMVLSGEGSDEIFGGYLYFLKAPSDEEHSRECVRRVSQLSLFDCLRANKSTMAWGLEARPPFLDTELVRLGLGMPAWLKKYKGIEKWILREAFNVPDPATGFPAYLPDDLLWRQKEQFSDGVGYGWIDKLKDEAESHVSDYLVSLAGERYPVNTPVTKEEYYYRTLFEELFPGRGREYTVQKWVPRTDWDGVGYDPSGRAQASHVGFNSAFAE
jgi:asparagine synthase (glutamine-hydrolysing)